VVDAAIIECRRLNPGATGDKLAGSGEVYRIIAAAISANPRQRSARKAGMAT
jgi:hypothetical protein